VPGLSNWTVEILPTARRALRQLPPELRDEILETLEAMQEDPFALAQPLRSHNDYYRIRFGAHRLIFRIFPEKRVALVTRIAHRSSAYTGYTPL
jgi:mRNA-degrading endonuclease RelE of RelBE toxin-antitoxin system